MKLYPMYLTEYPNRNSLFPFNMRINTLTKNFPAHRHDYLEFSYVIDGAGIELINGVKHPMRPGTFTLVLPYEVHELHVSTGDSLKLLNCNIGLDVLFGIFSHLGLSKLLMEADDRLPPYVQLEDDEAKLMKSLLDRMYHEFQGDASWKQALLGAYLIEALALFDRSRRNSCKLELSGAGSGEGEGSASERIWQVIHYVHTHYKEDLSLADIAGRFHFSMSHLSELFKKYVGQGFVLFLHEVRIRHALGLLRSTEMSMSEIAYEVGFGSYKTFSRVFRELKGMTPMEFRKLGEVQ
jgi:AraC-like DNA-binding protein